MADSYKKKITTLITISSILVVVSIIAIIFLSKDMAKVAERVENIRTQALTNQAFLKSYNALTEQKKNLIIDSGILQGMLPTPDDLITVQDRIQNLGRSLQVSATINFEILNAASGNEPANQSFRLNLTGTLANIRLFLQGLNDLPYFIKFDSFNIDKQGEVSFQPVVTNKNGTPVATIPPTVLYIMNANGKIYVNDQYEK
jgi:Tfp pilus assembly protein PilO